MLVCDAPGADVDTACERLRPRGYECVVVCVRARHAGHRAWPALQHAVAGRAPRPVVVAAPKHTSVRFLKGGILGLVNNVLVPHVVQQYEPNGPFYATGAGAAPAPAPAFPSLPSTETLESLANFDGRRSPSAFTAVSAGRASPAVAEPAPPTPPKEREKRDSLLCDGDTVDAVLGSVFD